MPRKPKPYVKDGWFCTSVGGVQHQKLCRVEDGLNKADLALARLKVMREDARREGVLLPTPGPGIAAYHGGSPVVPPRAVAGPAHATVAQVYDDFMDVKKAECSEHTYAWYRDKLDPFFERFAGRAISSLTYEDGLSYKNWLQREKVWARGKLEKRGSQTRR
jgi:hypothetical protein